MFKYRPLSPHLTIYNVQFSSSFSIWHRVTGVFNFFSLLSTLLVFKLSTWGLDINISFFIQISYTILKYSVGLIYMSLVYHILNGYRHLMWDLDIGLSYKLVFQSALVLISILFFTFTLNWIFIF